MVTDVVIVFVVVVDVVVFVVVSAAIGCIVFNTL